MTETNGSRTKKTKVCFLLGTPYTGSTLCAMLLDRHSCIATTGEAFPNRVVRGQSEFLCSCREPFGTCDFWRSVFEKTGRRGFDFSVENWPNDHRYSNRYFDWLLSGYSRNSLTRKARDVADRFLPGHAGFIRKARAASIAFAEAVLETRGKSIYFDASKDVGRLKFLLEIDDFELYLIRVFKDIRSFAVSAMNRGWSPIDSAKWWLSTFDGGVDLGARLPLDRQMMMRYEEFSVAPEKKTAEILRFLNLPVESLGREVTPREHCVIGNRIRLNDKLSIRPMNDWRGSLDDNIANWLKEQAAHRLHAVGYDSGNAG